MKGLNYGVLVILILVAIPIVIIGLLGQFIIENIGIVICIAVIVAVIIILVIVAKQEKQKAEREAYLRWYYDRDRRIAALNIKDKLDVDITNEILKVINEKTTMSIGKPNLAFDDVKETYNLVVNSTEIFQGSETLKTNGLGWGIGNVSGIIAKNKPLILKYIGENDGGYVFYVFSETILAFIEGPEQKVFLAAYKPDALKITCQKCIKNKETIVYEKTKQEIRYYDKFCPIDDAEIAASWWKVENKDGSRSFKGGLLPEHNPLYFQLNYGEVTFSIGSFSRTTCFSRYKDCMNLIVAHEKYKKIVQEMKTCKENETVDILGNISNEEKPKEIKEQEASTKAYTLERDLSLECYEEPEDIDYMIIKTSQHWIEERGDIYEATRSSWKISEERRKKYKYVLSVVNRIVQKVYEIEKWVETSEEGRYEFIGKEAPEEISSIFVGKRLPDKYSAKGMANPVLYKK